MISLTDTSIFQSLINSKIRLIASTALHIHDSDITSSEMNLLISCTKSNLLFKCDYKIGFFENEGGDVFYDYDVETGVTKDSLYRKSTVTFDTSEITQIEIYGRNFDSKEFISYPALYKKIKEENRTDDLFIFNCKNGERLIVVFHPYMPGIEVNFKKNSIEMFWNQYGEKYELHHKVK